jgi:hypothetical protein
MLDKAYDWIYAASIALAIPAAWRLLLMANLAYGNYSPFDIAYRDIAGRIGHVKGFGALITAANRDAQQTLFSTLVTKTSALVLGQLAKNSYAEETIVSSDLPATNCVIGLKLLIKYVDSTNGQRYRLTIPTLDDTLMAFATGARDIVLFSGAGAPVVMTDWVTAFEAFAIPSEQPTHAVIVSQCSVINRGVRRGG